MWRQDPAFPQRCASTPSSEVGQYDGPGPEQPSHLSTENPLLVPPAPSAERSGQGVWLLPSGEPAWGRPSPLSLERAASRRGEPRGACSSSPPSSSSLLPSSPPPPPPPPPLLLLPLLLPLPPPPPPCLFITLPSSAGPVALDAREQVGGVPWHWMPGGRWVAGLSPRSGGWVLPLTVPPLSAGRCLFTAPAVMPSRCVLLGGRPSCLSGRSRLCRYRTTADRTGGSCRDGTDVASAPLTLLHVPMQLRRRSPRACPPSLLGCPCSPCRPRALGSQRLALQSPLGRTLRPDTQGLACHPAHRLCRRAHTCSGPRTQVGLRGVAAEQR